MSLIIKKEIMNTIADGHKIIIVDPEKEYESLSSNLYSENLLPNTGGNGFIFGKSGFASKRRRFAIDVFNPQLVTSYNKIHLSNDDICMTDYYSKPSYEKALRLPCYTVKNKDLVLQDTDLLELMKHSNDNGKYSYWVVRDSINTTLFHVTITFFTSTN